MRVTSALRRILGKNDGYFFTWRDEFEGMTLVIPVKCGKYRRQKKWTLKVKHIVDDMEHIDYPSDCEVYDYPSALLWAKYEAAAIYDLFVNDSLTV